MPRTYRTSDAAYRRSMRTILVNAERFFKRDPDVQEAILAHEVGHTLCHHQGHPQDSPFSEGFGECITADWWACSWGYVEGLVREREESNGAEYCRYLRLWQDRRMYNTKMRGWHMRKLAGLG